jgi:hypothetical protein
VLLRFVRHFSQVHAAPTDSILVSDFTFRRQWPRIRVYRGSRDLVVKFAVPPYDTNNSCSHKVAEFGLDLESFRSSIWERMEVSATLLAASHDVVAGFVSTSSWGRGQVSRG